MAIPYKAYRTYPNIPNFQQLAEETNPNCQNYIMFFQPDQPCPLTEDQRRWLVSPQNPNCPLSKFVGNPKAVERFSIAAFAALGRHDHNAASQSFALIGPASTGKTTLPRLFAATIEIPYIEINPTALKSANDIVVEIAKVFERTRRFAEDTNRWENLSLQKLTFPGKEHLGPMFQIPPCVLFIDEIHALPKPIMNALLKAIEAQDRMLQTEHYLVDCKNICFIIATTHQGKLFGPFDSRFSKVFLSLYTKAEVAEIVHRNFPQWDMQICKLIAHYSSNVPREALAFAREMVDLQPMYNCSWEDAARKVAENNKIDDFGMTEQRRNILTILGQNGPVSKARMAMMVGMSDDIDALDKFALPPLMLITAEQPALITMCSRGLMITPAGLAELDRRNIKNLGKKAIPDTFATPDEEDLG